MHAQHGVQNYLRTRLLQRTQTDRCACFLWEVVLVLPISNLRELE